MCETVKVENYFLNSLLAAWSCVNFSQASPLPLLGKYTRTFENLENKE